MLWRSFPKVGLFGRAIKGSTVHTVWQQPTEGEQCTIPAIEWSHMQSVEMNRERHNPKEATGMRAGRSAFNKHQLGNTRTSALAPVVRL